MSQEKGLLRHPLFVTIASSLTLAAIAAVATYLGLTVAMVVGWLSEVAQFWGAKVTLARWAYWLWFVFTAALIAIVALRIYLDTRPQYLTPQQAYQGDVLFDLKWRWKVTSNGQVWSEEMYCPQCDRQFYWPEFNHAEHNKFKTTCKTCGYSATVPDIQILCREVKEEAERRIRTGEWKRTAKSKRSILH
ncbi:hypothetical protein [Paraburkholderia fungorum]|uniref:hypothetical protein n=1 Tax=Paraburkholderia fungorum TaxID=134537 RepID=UPI0020921E49|nr:hypothetical protein [Paraburkholderia fungorum]USU21333.1 hypothetical protein NFE55_30040 [Paraburkholderia fungorum]USU26671.1 hypothetical protein NFS19_31525 [Paraburkholderia fungorum]